MTSAINEKLESFYAAHGPEKVGFILQDGQVVEVRNLATIPQQYHLVSSEDLFEHIDNLAGMWHTHPGRKNIPSSFDKQAFVNFPDLVHYIVGANGVAAYEVGEDGAVKSAGIKADSLARLVEGVASRSD